MPIISVMMPVYNAEKYLHESINSILSQTEQDFELVIVNDGSTDRSEEIILSYDDPRIIYIKKENGGEASARNAALDLVKGQFVVFQDADDISLSTRLQTLKESFFSEEVGFVHSDMVHINENGEVTGYFQGRASQKGATLREYIKSGSPFLNASIMIRTYILKAHRYEQMRVGTDTDMGRKISHTFHSIHVPLPLYFYRLHNHSAMNGAYDDSVWFRPLESLIQAHSLEELIPEIDWSTGDYQDNTAKAKAILALLLYRRNFCFRGINILTEAENMAVNDDTHLLLSAIKFMFNGQFQNAIQLMDMIQNKDHIVHNYIGECELLLGNTQPAFQQFCQALKFKPRYMEAIDNIKGVAGILDFNLMDPPYYKEFHQHIKPNSLNFKGISVINPMQRF